MVNPLVIPSNLQWLGAAKEVTYGTPIAAPTFWIPVDGASIKWKPNQNVLVDQAYRGLMGTDFQQVAGMRFDTLDYTTYPYMDSLYQHFLALLGNPDTITGAADPWTHKTSLYNGSGTNQAQPPSYTLFYFDGLKCWQIPGCILGDLKTDVKVDSLATIQASWTGLPATALGSAPSNTPSTSKPMPSWNGNILVAGVANLRYSEVSLDYKRDVADVPTISGSQSPLEIFGGGVSVAVNMTALYQSSTDGDLSAYLSNTQSALAVKLAPVGDAVHSLTLTSSVVAYDSADPSGSNKWMEIAAVGKGLMNATDALDTKQSPAQAVFLSTQSTAF